MKKTFLFLLCISLVSAGAWASKGKIKTARQLTDEDKALVQCIKEKEVTMYGTSWCPHCKEQKAEFGQLFAELPYVDCEENPRVCKEKKVTGYPTWLTPSGKEIQPGSIKEIAIDAGCDINQIKEASQVQTKSTTTTTTKTTTESNIDNNLDN